MIHKEVPAEHVHQRIAGAWEVHSVGRDPMPEAPVPEEDGSERGGVTPWE